MTLLDEFDGCDLGDERRDGRLLALVDALARDPEMSFPEALGYGRHLEAAYRFLNNPLVDAKAILRPHILATAARMQQHKRVLVLHDTTHMQPSAKAVRNGMGEDGFRVHTSLAVSANGRREPLGLVAMESWARPDAEERPKRTTKERREDENRESKRWLRQSIDVEALVDGVRLIHVEDREADIYESLGVRLQRNMAFIVRAQAYRTVIVDGHTENILEHMRARTRLFRRTVKLSRRAKPVGKSSHSERDGRVAELAIAAASVVIRSPRVPGADAGSSSISVNVVHVIEENVATDEPPVEWLLLTTEPIETPEQVEFVIDSYRTRWMIEEYFKALKSGCAYESRQLESYPALQSALSIFAVIAWRLLCMRFLARDDSDPPATRVMSDVELKILRAQGRVGANPNIVEALRAVAALGGHLKPNGEPGWEVLWRGFRSLRDLVSGYQLALKEM